MVKRSAGGLALLFFTAAMALSSDGGLKEQHRSTINSAANGRHALLSTTAKLSEDEAHGKGIVGTQGWANAFVSARTGLTQAITLIEASAPRSLPRSNAARDAISPFYPNLLDPSAENIAMIEQHALAGSDDALAAFLTVAAHLMDFRERSQQLLLLNAARGSVLALTTLSERAESGFGFEAPDRATSIFFEYLAWSTGHWHSNAESDAFRPSISERYSRAECESATAFGKLVAKQHEAFGDRDMSSAANCVDPH